MAKRDVKTVAVTDQSTWEVLSIRRGFNGERSEAYVRIPDTAYESFVSSFDPDTVFEITIDGTTVFKGRALAPNAGFGDADETCECMLVGPEWDLDRCYVFGQRLEPEGGIGGDTEYPILAGIKAEFNPAGEPNQGENGTLDSDRLFAQYPKHTDSSAWTLLEAIIYLQQLHNQIIGTDTQNKMFDDPTTQDAPDAVKDLVLKSVRVHGLTVKEAFTTVLRKMGCAWTLIPDAGATNMKHTMVIFQRGQIGEASAVDLILPARDSALSSITTPDKTAAGGHLVRDLSSVASEVHGHTGAIIYEDTFTLIQGWSAADELAAFGAGDTKTQVSAFMRATNQDASRGSFETYKNVGRRYILNETGNEDNTDSSTTPYDFSSLFEGGKYVARPRPFLSRRVGKDQDGKYAEPEVLVTDPEHTYGHPKEYDWQLLRDIAGIYFTGQNFPYDPQRAIAQDDPQAGFPTSVTIKAALVGDDTYVDEEVPAADVALDFLVIQILDFEGKYEAYKIDGGAAQDRTEFDDHIEQRSEEMKVSSMVARFNFETITLEYDIGDWIADTTGRVITVDGHIVGIRWDCETQSTELYVESLDADIEAQVESKAPPVWRRAFTYTDDQGKQREGAPRFGSQRIRRPKPWELKLAKQANEWERRMIDKGLR